MNEWRGGTGGHTQKTTTPHNKVGNKKQWLAGNAIKAAAVEEDFARNAGFCKDRWIDR